MMVLLIRFNVIGTEAEHPVPQVFPKVIYVIFGGKQTPESVRRFLSELFTQQFRTFSLNVVRICI